MSSSEVTLRSTVGGYTAEGKLHTLSVWFILALRLMMGLAFLQSGVDKVLSGSFSAGGYLRNAPPANNSPVADLFVAMGETPWFVDFVNVAVPWGELFIGLGLLVGALTRLAAFWGAFMMLMFYLGNWEVSHGYINGDFACTCSSSSRWRPSAPAASWAWTSTSKGTRSAGRRSLSGTPGPGTCWGEPGPAAWPSAAP